MPISQDERMGINKTLLLALGGAAGVVVTHYIIHIYRQQVAKR